MNSICIEKITRDNWEEAISISLNEYQASFVPSVIEGLAYAYIKPWDEALDPYVIKVEQKIIGFFYISYTPNSSDNYWIGGFQIDKSYQGFGYGKQSMKAIIDYIAEHYKACSIISLTVEQNNTRAISLYEGLMFKSEHKVNQCNEMIYRLRLL